MAINDRYRKDGNYEDDFVIGVDDDEDKDPIDDKPLRGSRIPRETPRQVSYGGLGLGGRAAQRSIDPIGVAGEALERDASGWVKFRDWSKGIITNVKRGFQPRGSMADCKNFQPNTLLGALQQRNGYSVALQTPLNDLDGTSIGGSTIDNYWKLSTETPETKDIEIVDIPTAWLQKPYWNSSDTAKNAWRKLGSTYSITVSAIAGDQTTITFSGESTTNDFYNNGLLWNSTRIEGVFIQDYVGSTGVATPNEKIPTDWLTGDSYTLYLDFHDNRTFSPSVTGTPKAVNQGNSILFSGGQATAESNKLCLSMFIDSTYFSGLAKTPRVWGTYATEAEVKSDLGITFGNASAYSVANELGLSTDSRWFIGFLLRTHDGQLSALVSPSTKHIDPAAGEGIQSTITVDFPLMNKRIRYIEVFLGKPTSDALFPSALDWSEYYHVETLDLTNGSGWTYNESVATVGNYTRTVQLDLSDFNNTIEKAALTDWTGTTEYTRSTLSASVFDFHNGRLFAARAYDHDTGVYLNDKIVWSGFSGALGTPQYNVLPDIDGFSQADVQSGDADFITNIGKYLSELVVVKQSNSFRLDTSAPTPETWTIEHIANIGCDAPYTFAQTPFGLCWLSGDKDVYIYAGGEPRSLTQDTIQSTIRSKTTGLTASEKNQLRGWYNGKKKAYELTLRHDEKEQFWSTYFELPVSNTNFAWFRSALNDDIDSVVVDREGNVYFTGNDVVKVFDATLTDAGTAISTFFDTGEQTLDEAAITHLDKMILFIDQDSSATRTNNLDLDLELDGAAYSYDSISSNTDNVTKTNTRFERYLPVGCRGRKFRFKFNTNLLPATFTASGATTTPLTIIELRFLTRLEEPMGDVLTTV